MIVKYRMNSTCTLANMKADINAIILGTATSAGSLSSGCDTANTLFYGTYPSGTYAVVNAGTSTYSKVHNDYGSSFTHYFRLTYDSNQLISIALASGYTSGTDTLVNSQYLTDEREGAFILGAAYGAENSAYRGYGSFNVNTIYRGATYVGQRLELPSQMPWRTQAPAGNRLVTQMSGSTGSTGNYTTSKRQTVWDSENIEWYVYNEYSNVNIKTNTFNSNTNPYGIDIVITDKCLLINSQQMNTVIGIFDIGKNGITRAYTNSMLMCSVDLNCKLAKIPYTFKYSTNSYGASVDNLLYQFSPTKSLDALGNLILVENPVFLQEPDMNYAIQTVYGIYAIAPTAYINTSVYTDGTTYRYVYNGYAIPTT